jgi:Flp pilus assembly protein TadD
MADSERERIRRLRAAGMHREYLSALTDLVRATPDDVELRIETAEACVHLGDVGMGLVHFDAAWRLGMTPDRARQSLIGYGMALVHAGRVDEAVARLGEAVVLWPEDAALKAVLALALHAAGNAHAALATMLDVLIDIDSRRSVLDGHGRLLERQRDALLDRAMAMA